MDIHGERDLFLHNVARVSSFELIEPATGNALATIPRASADDVDRVVRAAQAAFARWQGINTRERGRILIRLANLIRDHADELATAESRNVGKPLRDARGEVALAS